MGKREVKNSAAGFAPSLRPSLLNTRFSERQSAPPLDFFGFRFLFLNRLPKALAQLFFVC